MITTLIFCLLATDPAARRVSLHEAVQSARERHPTFRQAEAQSMTLKAQADVQRSQLLPQLNGTAGYSRSTSNFAAAPSAVPRALSNDQTAQFASTNYFSAGLTLNQLLFDFGQGYNTWAAAVGQAASQADSERAVLAQVVLGVRKAFFTARASKASLAVARDTLENQEKHRDQVAAHVEVGKRPEIDLLQARTDYSNARLSVINAENDDLTAKAQLNQAMGVEGELDYEVTDETLGEVLGENQSTAVLLDEALQARPDYTALQKQVSAQESTVRATEAAYGPTLTGTAGLTEAGAAVNNLIWNWRAGVNLTWQIFGSGETYYAVTAARGTLAGYVAQRDITRQQVRLDLEQARLGLRASKEGMSAAADALANARQRLGLAEGRYTAGVGNIIELSDAQAASSNAAGQQVLADYKLAAARATFLQALGRID